METSVDALIAKQEQQEEKNKANDTRMDLQDKQIKELQEQLAKDQVKRFLRN